MEYIHIKSIEKYHPGYKDRKLQWCKAYFEMLNAHPEFEMLPETDKWRFIAFIMLELQLRKPIPINEVWLTRKGFNLKKRPISKTISMLHNFLEVVTEDEKLCVVEKSRVYKEDKEKEEDKEGNYKTFETETLNFWNTLCEKYPILSKARSITPGRRKHLKQRFTNKDFVNSFEAAIKEIPKCPFLKGVNDRKWTISFDWLILNDENYQKVLEGKYQEKKTPIDKNKEIMSKF